MCSDPSTVCAPTKLLHRDLPQRLERRIRIEGEVRTLYIYEHAISLFEEKWVIIRPASKVAVRVQDFQKSIPGNRHSDLGVCQPHEYLAIDTSRSTHWTTVQEQLEKNLRKWDLSIEANWNKFGHHAMLALLAMCRNKLFDVKDTCAVLKQWKVRSKDVELTFEGEGRTFTVDLKYTDAWDLRKQRISLVVPIARVPLPPTWYKETAS
ncbi:hypothetical protein LTR51_008659 [Lithohypha guttulata]|nr:hypothetical protein LTR51_008659 [Lithohypha guttulata]